MDDPTREAVKLLQAELAELEARALAPSHQTIIRRMLARAVECGPILRDIWSPEHLHPTLTGRTGTSGRVIRCESGPDGELVHWPDPDAHAQTIAEERLRILQTIILTAADAPARAAAVRAERRELPALLQAFAHHASEAAKTLERIQDHARRAGLSLPGPLVDLPELIERAAEVGAPEDFHLLQPKLVTLADQYPPSWPYPVELLQALSETADWYGYAEPDLYPITRQAHALHDFTRALDVNLAYVWPTLEALKPWQFTHKALASMAAVCLNLEPDDLPDDPRPR
jgi:hypothetical protein